MANLELNVIFLRGTDQNPHLSWRVNGPYGRPRVSFCFCEINSYDNADNVGDNREDDEDNDDDDNENWASLNLKLTPGLLEVGLLKLPWERGGKTWWWWWWRWWWWWWWWWWWYLWCKLTKWMLYGDQNKVFYL